MTCSGREWGGIYSSPTPLIKYKLSIYKRFFFSSLVPTPAYSPLISDLLHWLKGSTTIHYSDNRKLSRHELQCWDKMWCATWHILSEPGGSCTPSAGSNYSNSCNFFLRLLVSGGLVQGVLLRTGNVLSEDVAMAVEYEIRGSAVSEKELSKCGTSQELFYDVELKPDGDIDVWRQSKDVVRRTKNAGLSSEIQGRHWLRSIVAR